MFVFGVLDPGLGQSQAKPSPPRRLWLWLEEQEAKARQSQAKAGASKPSQAKTSLSTTQASETVKKARAAKDASDSEDEDGTEAPVPVKVAVVKTRSNVKKAQAAKDASDSEDKDGTEAPAPVKAAVVKARKYAPATIESDESAPESKPNDSESEAVASEDKSDGSESEEYTEDIAPNEAEFRAEVPRVLSKKSKTTEVNSDDEMKDVKGKGLVVEDLFSESEQESIEVHDKPHCKNLQLTVELESDDTLSDAPRASSTATAMSTCPQCAITAMVLAAAARRLHPGPQGAIFVSLTATHQPAYADNTDMQLHEAIAKGLTTVPGPDPPTAAVPPRPPAPPTAMLMILTASISLLRKRYARKVSAARQKKAEMERPVVRPAPAVHGGMVAQLDRIAAATVDAASRPESDWHISARLMFPAPGKDIGLTGQTDELKAVLHGCIDFIKVSLLFEDAYPAILSRAGFAPTYLLMAAQHTAAIHIKDRLTKDLTFAARLADIPLDRINISRGDIRQVAAQEVAGLFGFALSSPEEVKTIVNGRLQDHKYIFPVDPVTNRLKSELPFLNEGVGGVLKKAVFTGQFKTRNLHRFTSTNQKHPERLEASDAMVSLGATAVYAALSEYRATGKHQKIPFTASAYEDVYRNHMHTLSDTRAFSPKALHVVLHRLYNLLTESTTATSNATSSSALLINLVEIPDSD
ncbi:hypothetical protein K438DRAFT_1766794 [Mycena galopus ATCC 62051]|nr:hypothetical protein K438DRAFT_1766794 [Mycena galopus ATCC 62051]